MRGEGEGKKEESKGQTSSAVGTIQLYIDLQIWQIDSR